MEKGKEESGRAFGYPRYAVVRYAQWEPGLYIESIWVPGRSSKLGRGT